MVSPTGVCADSVGLAMGVWVEGDAGLFVAAGSVGVLQPMQKSRSDARRMDLFIWGSWLCGGRSLQALSDYARGEW